MSDLGFEYVTRKNGDILVYHHGKLATTLRGNKAISFQQQLNNADSGGQQQLMARITGNYKRGNEKQFKTLRK